MVAVGGEGLRQQCGKQGCLVVAERWSDVVRGVERWSYVVRDVERWSEVWSGNIGK